MSCVFYPFNYIFRSDIVFYDLNVSMAIPIVSHTGTECFACVVIYLNMSKGPETLTVKTLTQTTTPCKKVYESI